ncbi:MAG: tetratricopeptide repeat protein [Planctomycetota bacterium]
MFSRSALALLVVVSLVGCLQETVRPISSRTLLEEGRESTLLVDTKIAQYQELADEFPEEPKYRERLSQFYGRKGDYKQALRFIHEAQELDPDNPKYDYLEGRIFHGIGNYTSAEVCYREMIRKTPEGNYTGPYFELALLYLANEKPAAAKATFEKCLEIDPLFPQPHYHLAELALVRRDQKAAVQHLEEYLRLGGLSFHDEALQKLYRLQPELPNGERRRLPEPRGQRSRP